MSNQNSEPLSKKGLYDLKKQERIIGKQEQARKQKIKRGIYWVAAAFIIGGSVFGMVKFASRPSDGSKILGSVVYALNEKDWTKGNRDSKVTLIEYSCFECPACGIVYSMVNQLMDEFGDEINFTYRYFPLKNIHPNAELSARAAEAAGKQGKFWEMHNILFEKQSEWSEKENARDIFTGYAQLLGLNIDAFKIDLDSSAVIERITNDYESGIKAGINGTPTFFLNGETIQITRDYNELRDKVRESISSDS